MRHVVNLLLLILLGGCFATAKAQAPNTITTIAGGGTNGTNPTAAYLPGPQSVVRDGNGNTYFSVTALNVIYKVDTQGKLSIYAGGISFGFSGDGGPATSALLSDPEGIAVDKNGNLFIADYVNNRIRRVDGQTHIITTVAGSGHIGFGTYGGDGGPATGAFLANPVGVAVDATGNLFIADTLNNRIRKVDTSGIITTVAGNGQFCGSFPCGDGGPAISAQVADPNNLAVDSAGNIYISSGEYAVIRVVNTQTVAITIAGVVIQPGDINTVAGAAEYTGGFGCTGQLDSSGDGCKANQAVLTPAGTFIDQAGNLFIADEGNYRIREVVCATGASSCVTPAGETAGNIYTVVGNGTPCTNPTTGCGDGGSPLDAMLNGPNSVFLDSFGNIVISDTGNQRIRIVSSGSTPTISNFAGGGSGGDGGPATSAILGAGFYPIAVDSSGNVFISETAGERVRRVDAKTHTITTVAGNGVESVYGQPNGDNGPAVEASFGIPYGITLDGAGNIYVADSYDFAVRAINMQAAAITVAGVTIQPGNIATIAGDHLTCGDPNGAQPPGCGDGGSATSASVAPWGIAVDSAGNIYISDYVYGTNRVRKVDGKTGIISNFAGTGAFCSAPSTGCGNGGPATSAQLSGPFGLAVDPQGNLYIDDSGDNQIRKVDTNGIISLVAFSGETTFGGDGGPAILASMDGPDYVGTDPAGNLFIGGGPYNIVQRVDAISQTVATAAGEVNDLDGGFSGDGGPSTKALIGNSGLALDSSHNLYIADAERVRKVNMAPVAVVQSALVPFEATLPGKVSDSQTVTVANAGLEDFTVNAVSVTANFAVQNQCSATPSIAPLGTCSITVELAPAASATASPVNGTLTISTTDAANPTFNIALSGTVGSSSAGFSLSTTVSDTGSATGTVTSNPSGINCPGTCSVTFGAGDVVTLTPVAGPNSAFAGWSGACTGTGACVVTMTQIQSVTANFSPSAITVVLIGPGTGTVTSSPTGISCPPTCSASFSPSTPVTLTANTTGTSLFRGWGASCLNIAHTCQFQLSGSGNVNVTAFFGAPAMPFTLGQVLIADSQDGMIFVYSPTGTLLQVLNANVTNPSNPTVLNTTALLRGMAFDTKGNLYAANLDGASVVTFPSAGTAPTFLGNNPAPYSIVIDPVNDIIVGQQFPLGATLLEFAQGDTGPPTSSFFPFFESTNPAPNWVELLQDNETVLYTLGSQTVKSFDIKLDTQNPDFASNLPGPGAFALRQLSDGTVLVADSNAVVRFNSSGNVIQTYTIPSTPAVFFNLNLDPDGQTFWTNDMTSGIVYRINIQSGVVASQFNTGLGLVGGVGGSSPGIGGLAVSSGSPMSQSITQPLNPTAPTTFNYGPHSFTVTYPPGTNFSGVNMTVVAAQVPPANIQQRFAGTPFANAVCIVYSGAGGNCLDYQASCTNMSGGQITCPSTSSPTIAVKTSFDTLQPVTNPGFLTTPIGKNNWTNIFDSFYLQRIDPTMKGKTSGFSEFVAVDLGATNGQGAGTFQFLAPLQTNNPRIFPAGTNIPVGFQLTSIVNPGIPVTDAVAGITVVMLSPATSLVFEQPAAFTYSGGNYTYSLNTSGYAPGTYNITVYGNAFVAQQVSFTVPAPTGNARISTTLQSLTLNKTTNKYVAVFKITNAGTGAADSLTITASDLNNTSSVSSLPVSVGNVNPGTSAKVTLSFPLTAGAPKSSGEITISESYAGGTSGGGFRVTLP
jgi:sugar lactone lactonase YvrE